MLTDRRTGFDPVGASSSLAAATYTELAELVDAMVLETIGVTRKSSSLLFGTFWKNVWKIDKCWYIFVVILPTIERIYLSQGF